MRSIIPQGAEAMFQVGDTGAGFTGVPVRRVGTVLGRETITEMSDATRQDIPDSTFVVPAAFTKEAFGGGIGRGLGRGPTRGPGKQLGALGSRLWALGRTKKGRAPFGDPALLLLVRPVSP